MKPQNLEEKIVWYSIIGTYVFYFLGAYYIYVSLIAWLLSFYLIFKLYRQKANPSTGQKLNIPLTIWVWIISMLVMEVTVIMAHIDFDLGLGKIITTSINWARTWAYLALFPLIGCLNIRPQLIYRAVCILDLQSLLILPICYILYALKLPNELYISPLHSIGGNDIAYYLVGLYGFEEETHQTRLKLFAPWAPALGMVANIHFILACQESNKKWRAIGMIAAIALIINSFSRLGMLCLATVPILTWFLVNFYKAKVQIFTGILSFFAGIFATKLIDLFQTFKEQFMKARASSSRVREILGRMALERWGEAPIWGHGIVETTGPAITAFMPIGTHHTWFSLLFEKGMVGYIALVCPLIWSFIILIYKSHKYPLSKICISLLLIIVLYSFGERIETLTYIYWPALVVFGIALKEQKN
ncbi:O-antigen ligase family protein [Calothrix membranacea FACHB-236]|nr:O-antigen ligase family protein [Calothrix membranacea FACHB-236]